MGALELMALALGALVMTVVGVQLTSVLRRAQAIVCATDALAAMVDVACDQGVLSRPVAVIVVELRGLAADTIVEGAEVWTTPIKVVGQRILAAVDGAHMARIGPHKFGLVVSIESQKAALSMAERVVAVCRTPIGEGSDEVRIEAVAGICHRPEGRSVRGEAMIREADACLQIDPSVASPVVSLNRALRDYAVRVLAVESEVREGLDAERVGARLSPVVDVRGDRIVLLRSCPDWDAVSAAEPDVVASVARGLGFRRAIDTSMLLSALSASSDLSTDVPPVKVVVSLDAGSLTDNRGVSHIQLLLEVVGLAPEHVVIELNSWTIDAVGQDRLAELAQLGVGIGVIARHSGTWRPAPALTGDDLASVTVELGDLLRNDGTLAIERIDSLRALLGGSLERVTVIGVDDATSALELSALGLVLQSGWVHGRTMDPTELRDWMISRKS